MKKTTSLYLLVITIYFVHAEWPPQKWKDVVYPVADNCITESNVEKNLVEEARKGNLPDDDGFKKYLLCIFQKFDWIDTKIHEFEYWKIMTMVPPEMKKPVFELGRGCLRIGGEDYGKACLDFLHCLKKANSETFAFLF